MLAFNYGDRVKVVGNTSPAHKFAPATEAVVIDGSTHPDFFVQAGATLAARAPDFPLAVVQSETGKVQIIAAADLEVLA